MCCLRICNIITVWHKKTRFLQWSKVSEICDRGLQSVLFRLFLDIPCGEVIVIIFVYNERLFKQLLIQIIFLSFETKWINVINHDTVNLRYFKWKIKKSKYELIYCSDKDMVKCSDKPCKHGTCSDHPLSFACTCDPGYKGIVCDTR